MGLLDTKIRQKAQFYPEVEVRDFTGEHDNVILALCIERRVREGG